MNRLSPYLLLACFAVAGFQGTGTVSAAPVCAPSGWLQRIGEPDRETEKYNRKLHELELKRVRDRQKLQAEYIKFLQKKKPNDIRKLQERLDEFYRKQEELEEKYRKAVLKLERKMAPGGQSKGAEGKPINLPQD